MNPCNKDHVCRLLYKNTGEIQLRDIYRLYWGRRQKQQIWIVDGDQVFGHLYPAFIMGGNDQRYRFNPADEVWIDSRIGAEEFEYTLAHELIERKMMREKGWSYGRAHKAGLALEKKMRDKDEAQCRKHASRLNDPRYAGVYRMRHKRVGDVTVWIVDGPAVRRIFNGDFSFAGHDQKFDFIPAGEIWIDSAIDVVSLHYYAVHELAERMHHLDGSKYLDAYAFGLFAQSIERDRQARLVARHEAALGPVRYGTRERGVKSQSRQNRGRKRGCCKKRSA